MIPPSYLFPEASELAGRPSGAPRPSNRLAALSGGAVVAMLLIALAV